MVVQVRARFWGKLWMKEKQLVKVNSRAIANNEESDFEEIIQSDYTQVKV